MAVQKPMAGGTRGRGRGRGVLSWGEGTTTAEHAASAVLDDFWRRGFCGTAAEERHDVFMNLALGCAEVERQRGLRGYCNCGDCREI